jgi:predicted 3-demethylubiquinone-9 3-methyltransferase (glyoxalase superfamily)
MHKIVPHLWFDKEARRVGGNCGKAEEAMRFHLSVFDESKPGAMLRYGPGHAPDREGTVTFSDFKLLDTWFAAMDSAHGHGFAFNEAIAFMVNCNDQAEIDHSWEKLSAVPEAEQCGWLKDRYGLSWQIVPTVMNEMMATKDRAALRRVTAAFLEMKKFDIAALERAWRA